MTTCRLGLQQPPRGNSSDSDPHTNWRCSMIRQSTRLR
uniref:Uncharacterized protein n=1 Tax=Anguilla anguilla TaxID=7936 RepID=A0A0E9Q2G1_ANGAN